MFVLEGDIVIVAGEVIGQIVEVDVASNNERGLRKQCQGELNLL